MVDEIIPPGAAMQAGEAILSAFLVQSLISQTKMRLKISERINGLMLLVPPPRPVVYIEITVTLQGFVRQQMNFRMARSTWWPGRWKSCSSRIILQRQSLTTRISMNIESV
jgi:hypothetical protein